jgi:hypothetical protein
VKPSAGAIIGGVFAGSMTNALIQQLPSKILNPQIVKKLLNINCLNAEELKAVTQAVQDTLKNTGLDKKGVSIFRITKENLDEIPKIFTNIVDNTAIVKHFPEKIKKIIVNKQFNNFNQSVIPAYESVSKKVLLPWQMSLCSFHEIGHASKAASILSKFRPLSCLALPIALIALWKTKKPDSQQPESKTDKVTTFIKENAGKLTFAASLPILAEEALATFKGNGYAKKLLSPELASKVAKANALGFATYASLILALSIGIYLGVKVKDAITDKNIQKHTANQ